MGLTKTLRHATNSFMSGTGLGQLRTTHLPAGQPEPPEELGTYANTFPSMGGVELGPFLREVGRTTPSDTAIVEIGVWLGAGTAQLCCGIADRKARGEMVPVIHCYDRWQASRPEVAKAAHTNTKIRRGSDTLPQVIQALKPFGAEIYFHKGNIDFLRSLNWPVGAFILDAAKGSRQFRNIMRIFGPWWIPGQTVVVLMDYYYYKKTGRTDFACQARFIEAHPNHFKPLDLETEESTVAAAFLYTAEINFEGTIRGGLL